MAALKKLLALGIIGTLALQIAGLAIGNSNKLIKPYKRAPLQDIVTWDAHSLFIRGERVQFWSGEFHPYRLPSPGLWLDVFQKIKAMGYTGVSFYIHWSLLEGEQGVFRAEGIFDLQPFFDAALEAGIYLLARPGPYINAESSGGGFPGWLQTIDGQLRTNETAYVNAQALYWTSIGKILANGQITNGGPVVLVQIENEYSFGEPGILYPDITYFGGLEQSFRDSGIVIPFTDNPAWAEGSFVPGTPAAVDIYGYDSYPGGFNCFAPYYWADGELATYLWGQHVEQSPTTPHMIPEFQGGSIDSWGGAGYDNCASLVGAEFERVFYKNDLAAGITILNFYMTYGGTNWGSIGFPGVYTSYDYGSAIKEDRTVTRQKYSEAKLIANFVAASPQYLTSTPGYVTNTSFTTNGAVSVTQLVGANNSTNFYVARQTNFASNDTVTYKLTLPTSKGSLTIPRLTGHLSLIGRDSKVHVTDYDLNGHNMLYSTAEVFTWGNSSSRIVAVLYGDVGERHEVSFTGTPKVEIIDGSAVTVGQAKGTVILNWLISDDTPNMVRVGENGPFVYLVSRRTAYNMWTLPVSYVDGSVPANASPKLIASGGYLLRNATVSGNKLAIVGDLNATTPFSVLLGAPTNLKELSFNGQSTPFTQDKYGAVTATLTYTAPAVAVPNLLDLAWKYQDSLPEIQSSYDDSAWVSANKTKTSNIDFNLTTPTSLFSSDYGFNAGNFVFRGHFVATGSETTISLYTQGGQAYGMSAWLNSTFVGSFVGNSGDSNNNSTFTLPALTAGKAYVFTVVVDHMGYDENWFAGDSGMKNPRGILDYELAGRSKEAITWKITGNLGGDSYVDKTRGPLNEGGIYAERQGWHLPNPPTAGWTTSTPIQGVGQAGIGFYSTTFDLDVPAGYDVPVSFVFADAGKSAYRVQLFVNGYQFGKYIPTIGPQSVFPVPEGILNHQGTNYIAMTLWAQDATGAALESLSLQATAMIQSGYGAVVAAPQPSYSVRPGAY